MPRCPPTANAVFEPLPLFPAGSGTRHCCGDLHAAIRCSPATHTPCELVLQVLLDPYAKYVKGRAVFGQRDEFEKFKLKVKRPAPRCWSPGLSSAPSSPSRSERARASALHDSCHTPAPGLPRAPQEGSVFRGTFDFEGEPFDWGEGYKRPNIPFQDLVIAELPVRLFTGVCPAVWVCGWVGWGVGGGGRARAGRTGKRLLLSAWCLSVLELEPATPGCDGSRGGLVLTRTPHRFCGRCSAAGSSGLPAGQRGTYAGVAAKVDHLRELGVNAVELLPVFEYDELEFQRRWAHPLAAGKQRRFWLGPAGPLLGCGQANNRGCRCKMPRDDHSQRVHLNAGPPSPAPPFPQPQPTGPHGQRVGLLPPQLLRSHEPLRVG
jgi:hypothetical protein